MESGTTARKSRDLLSSPWRCLAWFGIPALAMIVAGTPAFTSGWRTIAWTLALSTLGGACIANALRCGRVHCYVTGPFFLLMAFIALLYGLRVLPLGRHGWNLIGLVVLVGAVVFCCLPEMMFGSVPEFLDQPLLYELLKIVVERAGAQLVLAT